MGLAADVQFHGWVKTDELVARMSSHDIFFMCSRWEGVPMATIEAMFCGLACVVPAIPGGLVYLVGRGGAVYPASGPEAASIALSALAEKPEALFQAKVLARERARELFARAAISEQYDRLESEARRLRFNQRVLDLDSSRPLQHVELSTAAKRILLRPLRIARRLRQSLP
jgi:glycosyltransferase involved in cell wall biosynthesis